MARAGRKASGKSKRRQSTRAGRGYLDRVTATPELLAQRRRATGRLDLPDHEPLAVLYGRGLIDQRDYEAGAAIRQIIRAALGGPSGAGSGWRIAAVDGGAVPMAQRRVAARKEHLQHRRYRLLMARLRETGQAAAQLTLAVALCEEQVPLVADILAGRPWTPAHDQALSGLRHGLRAADGLWERE